ncbi:hypothetical protein PInf_026349 [Phytophthora infestans]|nr:hypothetical protein PInf_026349 [Phytophthora infestans]
MIPAKVRLDLYDSSVKLPDEMVKPLIRSSNAPTKTEFGPNAPYVRAGRTPALHDGQNVFYQLSKFEDDGAISDVNTNSAVEGTSAVRAKEDVSAIEDSAITEGDPEERWEHALRDAQPVIDNLAKFEVIRPSIVSEANSAVSTLTTISAGINHVVTANSALGEPATRNDLGAVPLCHGTTDYARDECGRVDACPAVVADSAVQRPSVTTANSKLAWAAVDSASADLNTEGDSDVTTACRQDVSYPGDAFARTEASSAVAANSADQLSDATEEYDSREVLLHEGIKPNDDPATADSALEAMEAETGSDVVRRHDEDTIYLGDKFEHAGVRSAIAVISADTGPDVADTYDLSEVSLLGGTVTEIGVTNSAATVFDHGGMDYGLGQAEDDECNSTRDPTEILRQHYLAIAATEDGQEDDVADGKTDIFERSGTDLELTDYAHELAFLPDLTEVEPTELDNGAPNVKSSSHTPAQSARLVAELLLFFMMMYQNKLYTKE